MYAKKVQYSHHTATENQLEPYHIFSNDFMTSIVKLVQCSVCKSVGDHSLVAGLKKGLAIQYKLVCDRCEEVSFTQFSSPFVLEAKMYDINARFVYACKNAGIGYNQACGFITDLNLPLPMESGPFQENLKKLHTACEKAMEEHKRLVRGLVREMHNPAVDDDSVVDVCVSFDGSWQKRGHTSHNGVATAIDTKSGLAVDFEVLSNFCMGCKRGPKEGDPGYEEFMITHNCLKNTDSKSGAMEPEAAIKIWERSAGTNLHYTSMLSDGDSNSYKAVLSVKPYGEEKVVNREHCVNHVAKRVTTRLTKLVANNTVDDGSGRQVPLGGARGCLTPQYITRLQGFYRKAIVDHPHDVEGMKRAILATLYHATGTGHEYCPVDGWCKAKNSEGKAPKPDMPANYFPLLEPIYLDLSSDELLSQCSNVSTQNANECLNSVIWKHSPKTGWCSLRSVYIGTCMAVIGFNAGAREVLGIQYHLGLQVGKSTATYATRKDESRCKKAEIKAQKGKRGRIVAQWGGKGKGKAVSKRFKGKYGAGEHS